MIRPVRADRGSLAKVSMKSFEVVGPAIHTVIKIGDPHFSRSPKIPGVNRLTTPEILSRRLPPLF